MDRRGTKKKNTRKMTSIERPGSALLPPRCASAQSNRPTSFLSRPGSAASTQFRSLSGAAYLDDPSNAKLKRPNSSNSNRSTAACPQPTLSQLIYDANPPLGVLHKQFKSNSWFHANQRTPSQVRLGTPIHSEFSSSKDIGRIQQAISVMSRGGTPDWSTLRPQSSFSVTKSLHGSHGSPQRSSAVSTKSSKASLPQKLRSSMAAREIFGVIEEDHISLVESLTNWTPALHEAKPESLPSHYRTTTKHGSTAHTVWDFVWEKPVQRDERIRQEIKTKEDWEL